MKWEGRHRQSVCERVVSRFKLIQRILKSHIHVFKYFFQPSPSINLEFYGNLASSGDSAWDNDWDEEMPATSPAPSKKKKKKQPGMNFLKSIWLDLLLLSIIYMIRFTFFHHRCRNPNNQSLYIGTAWVKNTIFFYGYRFFYQTIIYIHFFQFCLKTIKKQS